MKTVRKIHWKKGYPIKKTILCTVWIVILAATLYGAYEIMMGIHTQDDIYGTIFCSIFLLITFFPLKKYVFKKNPCFPYLNKHLTTVQLEKLLEGEEFKYIEEFKDTILYKQIKVSDYWISINGYYVLKQLVYQCSLHTSSTVINKKSSTYIELLTITGNRLSIDTGLGYIGELDQLFYSYAKYHLKLIVVLFGVDVTIHGPKCKRILNQEAYKDMSFLDIIEHSNEIKEQCIDSIESGFLKVHNSI
ncbi:hypothetical protein [Tannockella kyphosi]|uniref:hypothetical protein n=1 Tax=Tannockella kyphosi TaxID=2899121 RepID=UPI002012C395|nr:hypothetical protein [Tannockella kyphosi]